MLYPIEGLVGCACRRRHFPGRPELGASSERPKPSATGPITCNDSKAGRYTVIGNHQACASTVAPKVGLYSLLPRWDGAKVQARPSMTAVIRCGMTLAQLASCCARA